MENLPAQGARLTCILSPSKRLFQALNTDEELLLLLSVIVGIVQRPYKTCIHWSLVRSEALMTSWLSIVSPARMLLGSPFIIVTTFSVALLGTTATIVDVVDGVLLGAAADSRLSVLAAHIVTPLR
jgi:hypothetical protein